MGTMEEIKLLWVKLELDYNNKTQTKWLNQFKNDTIINVNSKTKINLNPNKYFSRFS